MPDRPRLTPAMADVRRAVRENWELAGVAAGDCVLVAVSGGADSMALAAAAKFEADRLGVLVGAVIVEHGLQTQTKQVAERVAKTLSEWGLDPVRVISVTVETGPNSGGTEAAARDVRYQALQTAAVEAKAKHVMLGHTQNDQAETVLLGLTRGSGLKSIAGMATIDGLWLRPLLQVTRQTTEAFCADSGIEVWNDPHNQDSKFTRVRIRNAVLPMLEEELGPGVVSALARTAELTQIDIDYLDVQANEAYQSVAKPNPTGLTLDVDGLGKLHLAIGGRVVLQALNLFGGTYSKTHVDEILQLVFNWHGQKELTLPGVRVVRRDGQIILKSTKTLKPGAC
ncbi:MAG: hypothetical protein RL508_452 [Actinomycetota bacterium]